MAAPLLDDLAPEPAVLTGALVGYARVSTREQLLDRQLHALTEAGCLRVFAEKETGRTAERPELAACLDYLRPGDTLVVPSLDRLSRSLQDLITMVADLRRRGVGFKSLHEALDTTTPGGRLVFHVFAALAEFIRELIVEGTREGLDAARARGVRLGRPPAMTPEQVRHAVQLLTNPENSVASIARLLGVSRSTMYAHIPELGGGRAALTAAPAVEASPARPPADYVPYGERRPVLVADSLAELTGPTAGVVELPKHLDWSGSPSYNLDTPGRLAELYKTVLAEATRVDDLRTWLDGERLLQLWAELWLPPKVRRLWEERFPELAAARAAAPAA
jgi:DNA invertase Pin-like site-specific DNA recombinase